MVTPDGNLTAFTRPTTAPFNVVDSAGRAWRGPRKQDRLARLRTAKEDTEIFPLVNNFSPKDQDFEDNVAQFVTDPAATSAKFQRQIDQFFTVPTRDIAES